jgi:hypothetical protein
VPSPAEVELFRPTERPPVAMLCVIDDGDDDGEWLRLRADRFVIGRTEGDLVLPHDVQISGCHAELVRLRSKHDGSWRWRLTDLRSTNGTFVRAGDAALEDGQEFIVGRTRYRFVAAATEPAAEAPGEPPEPDPATAAYRSTDTWPRTPDLRSVPALVEITPTGTGERVPLIAPETWIGSDAAVCDLVPPNDPYVSPRHARISRAPDGHWVVFNNKSVNGLWVRVAKMRLPGSCQFLLGEQRFLFRVP